MPHTPTTDKEEVEEEEVGGSIPGCKISSPLDQKNLLGGRLPLVLGRWPVGLLSYKTRKQ